MSIGWCAYSIGSFKELNKVIKLKQLKYLTQSVDNFETTGIIALTQWSAVYTENSNMQIG